MGGMAGGIDPEILMQMFGGGMGGGRGGGGGGFHFQEAAAAVIHSVAWVVACRVVVAEANKVSKVASPSKKWVSPRSSTNTRNSQPSDAPHDLRSLHERIYLPGSLILCLYLTFGSTHGVGSGKRKLRALVEHRLHDRNILMLVTISIARSTSSVLLLEAVYICRTSMP